MKNALTLAFVVSLVSSAGSVAVGQVSVNSYEIIKGGVGLQTQDSVLPPINNWFYYEILNERDCGKFTSLVLDRPIPLPDIGISRTTSCQFLKSEGLGGSKTLLDTTVPAGKYLFNVFNGTTLLAQGGLQVTEDRYPSSAPLFTGNTYSRLQRMNSCKDFTVTINGFVPHPLVFEGYTQLGCVDLTTGQNVFPGRYLRAYETSFVIPAYTFAPGHFHSLQVFYIDYLGGPVDGLGVQPKLSFYLLTWLDFQTASSADFNKDGFVNGDDYDAYVVAFFAGAPSADFNGDGFVNGDDFDDFSEQFVSGC